MKELDAVDGIQYFRQNADIDLSGQKWTPFEFGGYFDGNSKTISNVKIDMSTANFVGFFSKLLTGGELIGIKLENINVEGSAIVGGLVGIAEGKISNSYASGSVFGTGNVGGLVGHAYTDASISNSYASGSVSGISYVGGLVGYADTDASISNSYASGSVTGSSNPVGGLVGYAHTNASISNSYASGSVTGSGNNVGGLVGYAYTNASISNSYASGSVIGFGNNVGGLVGYATTNANISSSYYDSQTTNRSDDVGKGIPRTTDEMKQGVPTDATVPRPIYVDWSTSFWDFGDTTDYPTLRK